jgi:glyoxylase-like metal-dependent hydrolase (beta-lactamase superfamily II)
VKVVDFPLWRERALWWPDRRVLVVADVLGTVGYFTPRGAALGVHPLLRPFPPRRRLRRFDPKLVLVGHGEGVYDASDAFRKALRLRHFSARKGRLRKRDPARP